MIHTCKDAETILFFLYSFTGDECLYKFFPYGYFNCNCVIDLPVLWFVETFCEKELSYSKKYEYIIKEFFK